MNEHWKGILSTDSHHVDGGGILIWYFLSVSASFSHYHKTSEIINLQGVHFESPFLRFRSVSTGHVSPGLRGSKNTWWSRTTPLIKWGATWWRKGRVSQAPPTRHTLRCARASTQPMEVPTSSHWHSSNNQGFHTGLSATPPNPQHHHFWKMKFSVWSTWLT